MLPDEAELGGLSRKLTEWPSPKLHVIRTLWDLGGHSRKARISLENWRPQGLVGSNPTPSASKSFAVMVHDRPSRPQRSNPRAFSKKKRLVGSSRASRWCPRKRASRFPRDDRGSPKATAGQSHALRAATAIETATPTVRRWPASHSGGRDAPTPWSGFEQFSEPTKHRSI